METIAAIISSVVLFFWASNVKSRFFRCILLFYLFGSISIGIGFLLGEFGLWLGMALGALAAWVGYRNGEAKVREAAEAEEKRKRLEEERKRLEEERRRKEAIEKAEEEAMLRAMRQRLSEDASRKWNQRKQQFIDSGVLSTKNPEIAALIQESVEILYEIYKIADSAIQCSLGMYYGRVSIDAHKVSSSSGNDTWSMQIRLDPIANLEYGLVFERKLQHTPDELEALRQLERFMYKYQRCFDAEKKQFLYRSRQTCNLPEDVGAESALKYWVLEELKRVHPEAIPCSKKGDHTSNPDAFFKTSKNSSFFN